MPRRGGGSVGVTRAEAAVAFAQSYIGTPYRWGGSTPGKGMDCSGMVSTAYRSAGMYIPRTTFTEYAFPALVPVGRGNLQPGDLLFYVGSDGGRGPGHVVMYTGSGQIIQAAHSGTRVAGGPVFWQGFVGARRHAQAGAMFHGTLPKGSRTTTQAEAMGLTLPGTSVVSGATGFLEALPRYLEMAGGGAVLLLGAGVGIYGATGARSVSTATRAAKTRQGGSQRGPANNLKDAVATSKRVAANEREAGADARKEAARDKRTQQRARRRISEIRQQNTEDYREQRAVARQSNRKANPEDPAQIPGPRNVDR